MLAGQREGNVILRYKHIYRLKTCVVLICIQIYIQIWNSCSEPINSLFQGPRLYQPRQVRDGRAPGGPRPTTPSHALRYNATFNSRRYNMAKHTIDKHRAIAGFGPTQDPLPGQIFPIIIDLVETYALMVTDRFGRTVG